MRGIEKLPEKWTWLGRNLAKIGQTEFKAWTIVKISNQFFG